MSFIGVGAATASALGLIQLGGDLGNSATAPEVESVSGSSPIALTPASLQWAVATSSPQIAQATQTSDAATTNITIAPQGAYASAVTNTTSGSLIVSLAAPAGSGTTEAGIVIKRGGSTIGAIQACVGSASYLAIYPSNTPSSTNYALLAASNGGTNLNGAVAASICVAGTTYASASSSAFNVQVSGGLIMTGVPISFTSATTATNAKLSQTAPASDLATIAMTVQAQNAYASATTNKQGGALILTSGTSVSGGNIGQVQIQVGGTNAFIFGGAGYGKGYQPASVALTTGTTSLTAAQASQPAINFGTSSLSGACTVIFPTIAVGQSWIVDATGVTFNAHAITLEINSTTMSTTISAAALWLVYYAQAGKFYAIPLATT